jgi:succinoglycan biosynthesis protein ExoA
MRNPEVSVIIPCYNEEKTIEGLLESIYTQTFGKERIEVVISDALSTDATRHVIEEYKGTHPDLLIKVLDNPKRIIPAALPDGRSRHTSE